MEESHSEKTGTENIHNTFTDGVKHLDETYYNESMIPTQTPTTSNQCTTNSWTYCNICLSFVFLVVSLLIGKKDISIYGLISFIKCWLIDSKYFKILSVTIDRSLFAMSNINARRLEEKPGEVPPNPILTTPNTMDIIIQQIRTSDPGDTDWIQHEQPSPIVNPSYAGPVFGDGDTLFPTSCRREPPSSQTPRRPHPAKSPHANAKTYKYINELVNINRDPQTGLIGRSNSNKCESNPQHVDQTHLLTYLKNDDWNETIEGRIWTTLACWTIENYHQQSHGS
jgi:hypothetical protein